MAIEVNANGKITSSWTGHVKITYTNNYNGSITFNSFAGYKDGGSEATRATGATIYLVDTVTNTEIASYALSSGTTNSIAFGARTEMNWNGYRGDWTVWPVNGRTYRLEARNSGVGNIDNYFSVSAAFDSRKRNWNNINILNPNRGEDGDTAKMNVYVSEDNVTYYGISDQPADFTKYADTYFDIWGFEMKHDYYEYAGVENVDQELGDQYFRKWFDGTTTNILTRYKSYYLDLNGKLDNGAVLGDLGDFGTASVIVDGAWKARNVTDYYASHPYDKTYEITEITAKPGYRYNGIASGSAATSGSIGYGKTVILSYSTIEPSNLLITYQSSTNNSITVSVSASGLNISNYTLFYKKTHDTNYSSLSLGTSTTGTITGLDRDTNYNIYLSVTNPGGTTTTIENPVTYSTTLPVPIIDSITISDLLPFSFTITTEASVTPARTLMYSYSWDDGINWTSYQNGNSYDVSGLNEETSYLVRVKVKALHEGSSAEDTETMSSETEVITPADQASIHIKKEGQWVKGKTWYKKDGHWVKAKKIYIKKDNIWYINKNDIDRAI